jgi:hypothetical protein
MSRTSYLVVVHFITCLLSALMIASRADAVTIFESGTLGPTGVTWSELANQTVPGTNVNTVVFIGVRFELTEPILTSQVGGHFAERNAGTFFGAIVSLDNANDFPTSTNLSTPDVLGSATLTFPNPSAEVYGNLNLSLNPGWYALVFGSGLFSTTGLGGAVRNGADIGDQVYFSNNSGGWGVLSSSFDNHRFVINGTIVPEPSTFCLAVLALLFSLPMRRKHRS